LTQRRVGVATFYVTHDQTEAMTMGDKVAVLHKGALQQVGTPQSLYERPDNIFVAAFIGSPAMNLYQGMLSPSLDEVKIGPQRLALPASLVQRRPGLRAYADRKVVVGIRPEHLSDAALVPNLDGAPTLEADVELVEALGNELQVHFVIEANAARTEDTEAATGISELGGLPLEAQGSRTGGVARVSPRSELHGGVRGRFVVDMDGVRFFDPDTGLAIWD
jgi:multiple sugar transport system ATP-binding protein